MADLAVQVAKATHPCQQLLLAVIEAGFDIDREDEGATLCTDAEGDGDGIFVLVTDGYRDPLHAQLVGAPQRAIVEPHDGLAGGQAHDLDLPPTHTADAQTEHLADGFLGGPAAGEALRTITHVGVLGRGQDTAGEAAPVPGDGARDALDLDDVDAQLRGARRGHGRPGLAHSTVTDLARLRG